MSNVERENKQVRGRGVKSREVIHAFEGMGAKYGESIHACEGMEVKCGEKNVRARR